MNVIGLRWVFSIKQKSDGSPERYKARLVAKGFHQQKGTDCNQIYSPVIKAATIKIIMSVSFAKKWQCNVFLNEHITDFMEHVINQNIAILVTYPTSSAWKQKVKTEIL